MIKIENLANTIPAAGDNFNGTIKNDTSAVITDGTTIEAIIDNDKYYAFYNVLAFKGITPNNLQEDGSNQQFLEALLLMLKEDSNPTGTLLDFAGNQIPTGYLSCDGSEVNRITFEALGIALLVDPAEFNVYPNPPSGFLWGNGDNSSTFNLPDLRDRVGRGKGTLTGDVGNILTSAAPNITGTLSDAVSNRVLFEWEESTGSLQAFSIGTARLIVTGGDVFSRPRGFQFNASISSSEYGEGGTTEVRVKSGTVNKIIKT